MRIREIPVRLAMRWDAARSRPEVPTSSPGRFESSDRLLLERLRTDAPRDRNALSFYEQLRGAL